MVIWLGFAIGLSNEIEILLVFGIWKRGMERRIERSRQMSPDRAKVSTHKSPNQHELLRNRSVPVVYYLCRDRQLDHPHYMEVPLSSPGGLCLKDVIDRLTVLRGQRVASMYSWSCKRMYKNGYVWHDLCDDDLIAPAHGNEYILKGSELFQESNNGRFTPSGTYALQNPKALPEPNPDGSSSSSSLHGRSTKSSHDDEVSPRLQAPRLLSTSPEYGCLADASTQTDEKASVVESRDTSAVSDDCSPVKQSAELCRPPSCGGQTSTLESLIQADVRKLNSLRGLEKGASRMPPCTKLKVLNMIMHLVSCGSASVKDHNFGLIPTYKPMFSGSRYGAPLFSTSFDLGEADCAKDDPRTVAIGAEDREFTEQCSNIAPSKAKGSLRKQAMCKSARSPLSGRTRTPSEQEESRKADSLANEDSCVIRIEERLASGARVIIQTKVS